jgi:hypothetical protein
VWAWLWAWLWAWVWACILYGLGSAKAAPTDQVKNAHHHTSTPAQQHASTATRQHTAHTLRQQASTSSRCRCRCLTCADPARLATGGRHELNTHAAELKHPRALRYRDAPYPRLYPIKSILSVLAGIVACLIFFQLFI